jgi:hypothetical protein
MSLELIVDLNEFSELCGVTAETMRVHINALDDQPVWLIEKGHRGRGYKIEPEGGVAWWRAKREADENASAERRAQLAQLRFDMLGDAVEDAEALSLSGKQRLEDYSATLKRIELRRIMGDLIERKPLQALLASAAVEHRRELQLVPGQMVAAGYISAEHAVHVEAILAEAVDSFWKNTFLPSNPGATKDA